MNFGEKIRCDPDHERDVGEMSSRPTATVGTIVGATAGMIARLAE